MVATTSARTGPYPPARRVAPSLTGTLEEVPHGERVHLTAGNAARYLPMVTHQPA